MAKELMTVSRMGCLLSCPRKHYWRYEIGLKAETDAQALRFGTAWHNAMEARWNGMECEAAFRDALAGSDMLDELMVATLSGLLAGYYAYWADDPVKGLNPEVEFRHRIAGSRTFDSAGKIDGLGVTRDGRQALVEHKTCGECIAPESEYWLRLGANQQVMQYVLAARELGWDVAEVVYDVTRKPSIRPSASLPIYDEDGLKIVVDDATGDRSMQKNGTPRQSGGAGYTVLHRKEKPEEYADRLANDCRERPEFYFARREVPVIEYELEEFKVQRYELTKMILAFRQAEKRVSTRQQAWPRNINAMGCKFCEYSGFCLQCATVDLENLPAGYRLGAIHSELEQVGDVV